MKKTTLAASLAALALVGGTVGIAYARMDGMHHGRGQMMMQMAERYDANKDGKISQEEIDQNRAVRHAEFDGDKNATLSLEEFKALWLKANNERMVREFQEFDADGNAQVTLDEYKGPMLSHVAQMDQNGDGVLSKDDHQAMKGKHGMKDGKRHKGMMDDDDKDNATEDDAQ